MVICNADARRYLRAIKKEIPCVGNLKKTILYKIREMVAEFISENPKASYSEIERRFGTPIQIASTYLAETETSEIVKGLKIRKKILTAVLFLAVSIFALWACVVFTELFKNYDFGEGYIIEEITDIRTVPEQEEK